MSCGVSRQRQLSPQTVELILALAGQPTVWRYGYDFGGGGRPEVRVALPDPDAPRRPGLLDAAWEVNESAARASGPPPVPPGAAGPVRGRRGASGRSPTPTATPLGPGDVIVVLIGPILLGPIIWVLVRAGRTIPELRVTWRPAAPGSSDLVSTPNSIKPGIGVPGKSALHRVRPPSHHARRTSPTTW